MGMVGRLNPRTMVKLGERGRRANGDCGGCSGGERKEPGEGVEGAVAGRISGLRI